MNSLNEALPAPQVICVQEFRSAKGNPDWIR